MTDKMVDKEYKAALERNNHYFFELAVFFSNQGFKLIMPVTCLLSLIFSCICFIVFQSMKLKENIYFYFRIKTIFETFIILINGLAPLVSCGTCYQIQSAYLSLFYFMFFFKFLRNVCSMFITILEIVITVNRYFIIESKSKILVGRRDKLIVFLTLLSSFIIFTPVLFFLKIEKSILNIYQIKHDNSKSYIVYLISANFIQNVLPILIMLPANLVVLFRFKKFIAKKKSVTAVANCRSVMHSKETKTKTNVQRRFMKMILIISFVFLFSRIVDCLNMAIQLFENFFHPYLFLLCINSGGFVAILVNNLMLTGNFFIFYTFNKPFRDTFICIFKSRKV